jgi:uncharacterized protein (DUF427 family)
MFTPEDGGLAPCAAKPVAGRVTAVLNDFLIASTDDAYAIIDDDGRPSFLIPPKDLHLSGIGPGRRVFLSDRLGLAMTLDIRVGPDRYREIAWTFSWPHPEAAEIQHLIGFDPTKVSIKVEPIGHFG